MNNMRTEEAHQIQEIYLENETGDLKEVIIGLSDNFHDIEQEVEIVNLTQAYYYNSNEQPKKEILNEEFKDFKKELERFGVKVNIPKPCPPESGVPDSLTPRDIGFVIGNYFFISNMVKKSRKNEILGIKHIIDVIEQENVIQIPEGVFIEGGDIIVDKGTIFVGISQRTTLNGFYFLKSFFKRSNLIVVPIFLKEIEEGEDCLHLDCVFNPVGHNSALIYKNGMKKVPDNIVNQYDLIHVDKKEQKSLGTNVLSISKNTVFSRDIHTRINKEMEKRGIEVVPITFNEAPKTGGSLRCCSLPLIREK